MDAPRSCTAFGCVNLMLGNSIAELFTKIVFSLFEKHYSTKAIQEVIPDCDAFVVNQLREEWGVLEREEKFHRD